MPCPRSRTRGPLDFKETPVARHVAVWPRASTSPAPGTSTGDHRRGTPRAVALHALPARRLRGGTEGRRKLPRGDAPEDRLPRGDAPRARRGRARRGGAGCPRGREEAPLLLRRAFARAPGRSSLLLPHRAPAARGRRGGSPPDAGRRSGRDGKRRPGRRRRRPMALGLRTRRAPLPGLRPRGEVLGISRRLRGRDGQDPPLLDRLRSGSVDGISRFPREKQGNRGSLYADLQGKRYSTSRNPKQRVNGLGRPWGVTTIRQTRVEVSHPVLFMTPGGANRLTRA